jgi:membrane protease YdiL (CAAX protease family)
MNTIQTQQEQEKDRHPILAFIGKYPFPIYVALTLAIGWLPWYLSGDPAALVFVPTLTALIVAPLAYGKAGLKDVLSRAVRWRAPWYTWATALFAPAIMTSVAIIIYLALGGQRPNSLFLSGGAIPLAQIGFLILVFLLPFSGAFAEFGFRGFALPLLQKRWGPLLGTLILGVFFALWLLPEFFDPDSAQYAMGGISFLPIWILTETAWSVLMTWVFNRSKGSSLIAGYIFHAAFNFWTVVLIIDAAMVDGEFVVGEIDTTLLTLNSAVLIVTAVILTIVTKGRLGYPTSEKEREKLSVQV